MAPDNVAKKKVVVRTKIPLLLQPFYNGRGSVCVCGCLCVYTVHVTARCRLHYFTTCDHNKYLSPLFITTLSRLRPPTRFETFANFIAKQQRKTRQNSVARLSKLKVYFVGLCLNAKTAVFFELITPFFHRSKLQQSRCKMQFKLDRKSFHTYIRPLFGCIKVAFAQFPPSRSVRLACTRRLMEID